MGVMCASVGKSGIVTLSTYPDADSKPSMTQQSGATASWVCLHFRVQESRMALLATLSLYFLITIATVGSWLLLMN